MADKREEIIKRLSDLSLKQIEIRAEKEKLRNELKLINEGNLEKDPLLDYKPLRKHCCPMCGNEVLSEGA